MPLFGLIKSREMSNRLLQILYTFKVKVLDVLTETVTLILP